MRAIQQAPDNTIENTLKSLRGRIVLSRMALLCERFVRAFWPFLSVCAVIAAVILWGFGGFLPMKAYFGLLALGLLGLVITFVLGLARFHWPTRVEAILRLDEHLPDHPLATLLDRQSIGADDPASVDLWNAHVARMAQKAKDAKVHSPDMKVAKSDPWALRLIAVLFLATGAFFGRPDSVETVSDRLTSTPATHPIASFEGWVEPPRYTGLPVLYLNDLDSAAPVAIPVNSKVTLRVYGDPSATLEQTVFDGDVSFEGQEAVKSVSFPLTQKGRLSLTLEGAGPQSWAFTTLPDTPPMIDFDGEITASGEGVLQLPFKASDDYGVATAQATIALDIEAVKRQYGLALLPETFEDLAVDLPMPFRGGRDAFADVLAQDFSQHPWAGQPVTITLHAVDDAGQATSTPPLKSTLLGRSFFNPVAAALVEQRRDLLWNGGNMVRVVQVLKAITHRPEDLFANNVAFLSVRTAIRRLEYSGLKERDSVADLLWKAALLLEDGGLGDAQERLKRAQDRLSEAMKDGASEAEIDRLMEELRQAMQDVMREGARNAQRSPSDQPDQGERQEITQDQLNEMMDKIEQLMRDGQMAEAEQLLEQMRQMMENLQFTQGDQGEGGEGQQTMEGLQDTLRQQQQLADEAFRQLQEQYNQSRGTDNSQGLNSPGNQQGHSRDGQSGQEGENTPNMGSAQDLAQRQEALRQMLEEQRGQLEGEAGGQSLSEADRAMDQAQQNLSNGNTQEALDNQADAMEALRQGMQEIGEGQRQGRDRASRQGDQDARNSQPSQDPLGREAANGGVSSEGDGIGDNAARRAEEVLEEIRRRSGERTRPEVERNYLERLLDRF